MLYKYSCDGSLLAITTGRKCDSVASSFLFNIYENIEFIPEKYAQTFFNMERKNKNESNVRRFGV